MIHARSDKVGGDERRVRPNDAIGSGRQQQIAGRTLRLKPAIGPDHVVTAACVHLGGRKRDSRPDSSGRTPEFDRRDHPGGAPVGATIRRPKGHQEEGCEAEAVEGHNDGAVWLDQRLATDAVDSVPGG